jgi:Fe2+ transport system protein FeoA
VQVIGLAPLGGPVEILLRDYRLSLRRSEAARVAVQLIDGLDKSRPAPESRS